MKRYIKTPLKYALPLLFVGALVLVSISGCSSPVNTSPSPSASGVPTVAPTATPSSSRVFSVEGPGQGAGGNVTINATTGQYVGTVKDSAVAAGTTYYFQWVRTNRPAGEVGATYAFTEVVAQTNGTVSFAGTMSPSELNDVLTSPGWFAFDVGVL
jgi:hypothetical protein